MLSWDQVPRPEHGKSRVLGRASRLTASPACRKRTTELTEQLQKEETEQKRLEDEVAKLKAEIKALEAKLGDLRKHTKPDEKYALLSLVPSVVMSMHQLSPW